jgi:hypothetical protein
VRPRPLVLLPYPGYDTQAQFSATISRADYYLNEDCQTLHVGALLVDKVVTCGPPYYASLCENLQMIEHDVFGVWYELAKGYLANDDFESMFVLTWVIDTRITLEKRGTFNLQLDEITTIFRHWVKRSIDSTMHYCTKDSNDLSDSSAHFRYLAEEACCNWILFITKNGRLELGSTYVSPGAYIYLVHGLRTPFIVYTDLYKHTLHGECYIHSLMDQQASVSDLDVCLDLI